MTLTRKDGAATVLTALAVLVFAAAHESWNVWLVGSSNRWAAAVVLLLGVATCSLGTDREEEGRDTTTTVLSAIGMVALLAGLWALAMGSLNALTLLVVAIVALWAASTARHASHATHRSVAH